MKKCSPVVVMVLLFILSVPGQALGSISLEEREALLVLYNKTNGNNWLRQGNWNKGPGTEHTWHGITCDANNTTVLKIELPGNGMQGVLPADLEVFTNLTTLNLSGNRLSGEIPRRLVSLKNLKKLDLGNNDFSGPIPAWLGNLKDLEELVLDNNRLEGSLPKELANLKNLKVLRLAGNRLAGDIPAELARLLNLEDNRCDFKWNGLYSQDANVRDFLRKKQIGGDWDSTQTTAPTGIEVIDTKESTITIRWQPIPYSGGMGGYHVFYREEGQEYDDKGIAVRGDKTANQFTLEGLKKSSKYYLKIRAWTDSHGNNKNSIESPFSDEIPIVTRGIIITGFIRDSNGKGVPGVEIKADNGGGIVETGADGIYRLSVMPGWTGKVTPLRKGYIFTPSSRNYIENTISDDYSTEYGKVISGSITYKGEGVGDVKLNFIGDNGKNYSTLTDKTGSYNIVVSYDWSGTVTPIKERHGFKPVKRRYDKDFVSLEDQDYEVRLPTILGRVKRLGGKGISGVRLNLTQVEKDKFGYLKDSVTTDDKGNYEIGVLENWVGDVIVESSKESKYSFSPPSRKIMNPGDAKKAQKFKAWGNYKFSVSIIGNTIVPSINDDELDFDRIIMFGDIEARFILNMLLSLWIRYCISVEIPDQDVIYEESLMKPVFSMGIGLLFHKLKIKSPIFEPHINFGIARLKYEYPAGSREFTNNWGGVFGGDLIINISDRWLVKYSAVFFFSKYPSELSTGFGFGYRF